MLLIHFDKPLCAKHRRPLEFLCMSQQCACPIRLCAGCTHEHSRKYSKSDFMKDGNFYKKLQMEGDIINKQYGFIQRYAKQSATTLLNSKNDESIKIVECVMRAVNEDKRSVLKAVEQFTASHTEVKKKLASINPKNTSKHMNSLVGSMLGLLSENGLQRLKSRVVESQSGSKKYCEFLSATQKYGDCPESFLSALGFKNRLLRESLKCIIKFERRQAKAIAREEKKASEKEEGVLLPSSGKKIRLLTPLKRPRTSCSNDKKN